MSGNNKGLTINLSFLASDNQNNNNNNNNPASSKSSTTTKSPKNFEEPNGAVGLGILAAMNESDPNANPTNDLNSSAKSSRGPILSVSPRSIPIPIWSPNSGKSGVNSPAESEEYTCVISHIGNNLIKKCEYFDGDLGNGSERTTTLMVGNGVISASSSLSAGHEAPAVSEFEPADFLNSCYLCEKELHGLDIFMYRGEKAFCSAECRDKQIASDERREKRSSGVKKPLKYSVSPCSDQLQFLAGVAAA